MRAFSPQRIHEFKIVRPPVPFRARWGGQSSASIQPCPPLSLSNGTDFRPTFTAPHKSPLCSSSEGRGLALHPPTGIPAVPSSGHGRTISVWPRQRSQPPPSPTLPSDRQRAASAHRQTCGNATRPFDRNANGVAISRMRPARCPNLRRSINNPPLPWRDTAAHQQSAAIWPITPEGGWPGAPLYVFPRSHQVAT